MDCQKAINVRLWLRLLKNSDFDEISVSAIVSSGHRRLVRRFAGVFYYFLSDYYGFFASDQAIKALGGGMASRATSLFRF